MHSRCCLFRSYLDTRKSVRCYGYLVELDGQRGGEKLITFKVRILMRVLGDMNGPSIIGQLNEYLMCDAEYNFCEWRSTTNSISLAQVKILMTTIEHTLVRWMEDRVVVEVESLSAHVCGVGG